MSEIVILELNQLVTSLQNDTSTKVVLFKSGNPTFFAAHFDVIPRPGDPIPVTDPSLAPFASNVFFNITQLPQATIAVIEGAARGLGNELIFSCYMRFASSNAVFGNFETSLGTIPGAGGAIYMPQLIGRGRAFEYLLSGNDIDAGSAEKYGWINRMFNSSSTLDAYVNDLAARIALFPREGLIAAKACVNLITRPTKEDLAFDSNNYSSLVSLPDAQQLFGKFLILTKNETDVEVELNLGAEVVKMYQ